MSIAIEFASASLFELVRKGSCLRDSKSFSQAMVKDPRDNWAKGKRLGQCSEAAQFSISKIDDRR